MLSKTILSAKMWNKNISTFWYYTKYIVTAINQCIFFSHLLYYSHQWHTKCALHDLSSHLSFKETHTFILSDICFLINFFWSYSICLIILFSNVGLLADKNFKRFLFCDWSVIFNNINFQIHYKWWYFLELCDCSL